ncbi:MAG: zinc ABC transporter substrate-binding protein [Spirochaetota bacterium]|nr:zinc ABC transporter substrate-binding protein [Spirochaetota bacterium]
MKKTIILLLLIVTSPLYAKLKVITTYPYIADITSRIGGDSLSVHALASGNWDPHFVTPKPSLIAKVRRADLLILNGAELEIGWMPPVIREARNAKVQPGSTGFLDLSIYIKLIDVPGNVSRAQGDVHPSGNPHYALGPINIAKIAVAIKNKLNELDPGNRAAYTKNHKEFNLLWDNKLKEWEEIMKPLRGIKVVQYHKNFDYLFEHYGMIPVIELEPLPGIAPTTRHIMRVIDIINSQGVRLIINDVYHSQKPAQLVVRKTGMRMITLPHDVNAIKEAKDIVALFDEIVGRLSK